MEDIKYYYDLEQGTDEWLQARLGIVTASEVNNLITPKGTNKLIPNKKGKVSDSVIAYACEIAAQREFMRIEETFLSWDMQRGHAEEVLARDFYSENYLQSKECGFIVRDFGVFKIGGSPDGLIGENGGLEIKCRKPKFQVSTIVSNEVPEEYINQIQASMLISGREWWDFVSYSNGLPFFVKRVFPDPVRQEMIGDACHDFEALVEEVIKGYNVKSVEMPKTERVEFISEDITLKESSE